jgi:hypothetical protein
VGGSDLGGQGIGSYKVLRSVHMRIVEGLRATATISVVDMSLIRLWSIEPDGQAGR